MSDQLKPWYAIATPHEDIRKGRLDESVFAANIWAVVQKTAPEVYLDPEEFFRKTHMTVGLGTILARVSSALRGGGEAGNRNISLQTPFGGGKTHTLVALWHMAKHTAKLKKAPYAEGLRKAVSGKFPEKVSGVAVFTNATCDVVQGRKTNEGVHTRTLWGELAFQLGGKALYEKIRANDESRTVPQGIFVDVLSKAAPCLILLDELADYCVGAAAVSVGGTTLADQTISFIQQLTEAVQQVPGVVVVATLPASKHEVAQSEKGQEAFITLERRFQRLGSDVKPVADDEIYEVVRARLFETITPEDEQDYPKKVALAYQNMYAAHSGEVPSEAAKSTYREQLERAYPFHPALIDALYRRWGSHPDFQRTRGVLRLLASIVGDLWKRREGNTQTQHLIQPADIRWSVDAVQAALTRLWGAAYQSVIAADVEGDKSNAAVFDDERGGDYRQEGIGQGLAAAIMLGSFGGQGARSGFSSKDLKLVCSRAGVNWNYVDGALLELEERSFYLHAAAAGNQGKRYWFGTKPTLNRLVVQYRQQVSGENFDEDIVEAIRDLVKKAGQGKATWRVLVAPESELPEQKGLALVVLPPGLACNSDVETHEAVKQWVTRLSKSCGQKDRTYRNTLVFLAAHSKGLAKLRQAFREKSALQSVERDYGDQLDAEQSRDLEKRIETAQKSTSESLGPAYVVALRVNGQEVEEFVLGDAKSEFTKHLEYLWSILVEEEEWILCRVGSVTLRDAGIIPESGGLSLKDAIESFLRYTDKPMIASRQAVSQGVAKACADGVVGLAWGTSLAKAAKRECGKTVDLDPGDEGVWIIPPFKPDEIKPADEGGKADDGEKPDIGHEDVKETGERKTDDKGKAAARKVRRFEVKGAVPMESWGEVFRCFVSPAAQMKLKHLKLGIQFQMESDPSRPLDEGDQALKAMEEAARQLGLKLEIFEADD